MRIQLTSKAKVNQLVTLFRHLKNLVDNVNIHLTSDKFYIQGMDPSHACLVEVNIQSAWFDEYKGQNEVLGVNCELLFKVIDCWKEGQIITVETRNEEKLLIDFDGGDSISKSFSMPLVDLETEVMDIPDKEYSVDMALKSTEFKEIISELTIFNKELTVKCTEESILLEADGDAGKMQAIIKESDIEEYCVEEDCDLDISFAISYINQMCAFCKLNEVVYIHTSLDTPLKMHYSLDDEGSEDSSSYVRFYVAPIIPDD